MKYCQKCGFIHSESKKCLNGTEPEANLCESELFEDWQGTDADLETSLIEYGIILRKAINPSANEYQYQSVIKYSDSPEMYVITGIDEDYIDDKINDITGWSSFQSFLDWTGCSDVEEFKKCDLIAKVGELIKYFGYEEIFGSGTNFGLDLQTIEQIVDILNPFKS